MLGYVNYLEIVKCFLLVANGVLITKNNLLATTFMGQYFEISLQMWIESYNEGNMDGFCEFLRFSATGNDCCSPGDRIPAIFTNKNGWVKVTSYVDGKNYDFRRITLPVKTWINIVVKQFPENGKVV